MWALLKALLGKLALIQAVLQALKSLGWLLPLAFLLKVIGLPILIVLLILAIPLLLVLAAIGLPLMLVTVVGGGLLAVVMWVLSMGLVILKILVPILAFYWLARWLLRSKPVAPEPGISEV